MVIISIIAIDSRDRPVYCPPVGVKAIDFEKEHGYKVDKQEEFFDPDEEVMEEALEDEETVNELKTWLFKENIRLQMAQEELDRLREQVEKEKIQFQEDMHTFGHKMETDQKRLEQENRFFDQKMQILQSGFAQLDADRRKLQKEKDRFDAKREVYHEEQPYYQRSEMAGMLFRGVNSLLALKKRYKDLIKMYHPDNVAGDHEMVQIINQEYEELKKAYDMGKRA